MTVQLQEGTPMLLIAIALLSTIHLALAKGIVEAMLHKLIIVTAFSSMLLIGGLQYLPMTLIIVYAGAIIVLMIYTALTVPAIHMRTQSHTSKRTITLLYAVAVLCTAVALYASSVTSYYETLDCGNGQRLLSASEELRSISWALFEYTPKSLLLLGHSLLIAMIGAMQAIAIQSETEHNDQLAAKQISCLSKLSSNIVRKASSHQSNRAQCDLRQLFLPAV